MNTVSVTSLSNAFYKKMCEKAYDIHVGGAREKCRLAGKLKGRFGLFRPSSTKLLSCMNGESIDPFVLVHKISSYTTLYLLVSSQ